MAPGAIQLDPGSGAGLSRAAAGADRQPSAALCRRPGCDRRPGRPARQPLGDGHAVQPDELHRQEGPGPAGEDSEGCAGRRSVGARLFSRRQHRQRRDAHSRLLGRRRQHRLQRPLRHPAVFHDHAGARRAHRGAEGPQCAADRHGAAVDHRRRGQRRPQARARRAADPAHGGLQFDGSVRRPCRRRAPLRQRQAIRRALQRRVPRRPDGDRRQLRPALARRSSASTSVAITCGSRPTSATSTSTSAA